MHCIITEIHVIHINSTTDEAKKKAHDLQIVKVTENLKFSHGWLGLRKASIIEPHMKALAQGFHQSVYSVLVVIMPCVYSQEDLYRHTVRLVFIVFPS